MLMQNILMVLNLGWNMDIFSWYLKSISPQTQDQHVFAMQQFQNLIIKTSKFSLLQLKKNLNKILHHSNERRIENHEK